MTEEIKAGQIIEYDKDNTPHFIVDGVDVSGCEHHLSTGYCRLQMIFKGMVLKLPFGKHLECNLCDKDCYYKQLKMLELENKKLKEALDEIKRTAEEQIKRYPDSFKFKDSEYNTIIEICDEVLKDE